MKIVLNSMHIFCQSNYESDGKWENMVMYIKEWELNNFFVSNKKKSKENQ